MHHCVWSRNLKNEEAMARVEPQRHRKQTNQVSELCICWWVNYVDFKMHGATIKIITKKTMNRNFSWNVCRRKSQHRKEVNHFKVLKILNICERYQWIINCTREVITNKLNQAWPATIRFRIFCLPICCAQCNVNRLTVAAILYAGCIIIF